MINFNFSYHQYENIDWTKQDLTKINSIVNQYIIKEIIAHHQSQEVKIFDIGFGIGLFFEMINKYLANEFDNIILEGCEPSKTNYDYFISAKSLNLFNLKSYNRTYLATETTDNFNFITAIYVFPHISSDELMQTATKIKDMLADEGKFILVVTNFDYLINSLKINEDKIINRTKINFKGTEYEEILHYSDLPEIGRLIDINRDEEFYIKLFSEIDLNLDTKTILDDNGFVCSIMTFKKYYDSKNL